LDPDSIIHAARKLQAAKYANYQLRRAAWWRRAYIRVAEIQEEMVAFYGITAYAAFHWRPVISNFLRDVAKENARKFVIWNRRARVAAPPGPTVMHQAYRVACTDVAAIIRAMTVKIRQPASLSFI
jgi:hypothetical protein